MSENNARHESSTACTGSIDRRDFMGAIGLSALSLAPALAQPSGTTPRWTAVEGPNQPMGEAKGIFPGRVVWIHDRNVAKWDGDKEKGGWWEDRFTDPVLAGEMLTDSLRQLTGTKSDKATWAALFQHFNKTHERGNVGYRPGEKVVVKLNMNCSSRRDRTSYGFYNTPQLTQHLLRQLVREAGVRESDIIVTDASRWMNDTIFVPCHAEFPGITFEDCHGVDGRRTAQPDQNVSLHFGDPSTPDSGKTYLPASITAATYVINAANFKGHALAGVTLCAKNHFGSVHREATNPKDPRKGWDPSHVHSAITSAKRPMGTYNAIVDFMGHKDLGGKTILYLIDALYAAPHQSVPPEKWQSSPFDDHWTASVFASLDPVAIESVGVDFFGAEKTSAWMAGAVDNYLHEAALAQQPPSKTRYAPSGDGKPLTSLGVHEHWNSPEKKQYSRNLGSGKGIELLRIG